VLYFVVARDGIEPPTPAFSGLDTAILISLISLRLLATLATFPPTYWNNNGTKPL
jgi:hypothetical protein